MSNKESSVGEEMGSRGKLGKKIFYYITYQFYSTRILLKIINKTEKEKLSKTPHEWENTHIR